MTALYSGVHQNGGGSDFFGGNKNAALPVYRNQTRRPRWERLQEAEAKRRLEEGLRKRERSRLPEIVTLRISSPPLFDGVPLKEIHQRVRERLDGRVQEIHRSRKAQGQTRFMGAKAVRAQDPFQSVEDTFPALKRDPRIACTPNARLRIELLTQLKAWRAQYRLAYLAWKAGKREATFPFGTYALRVFHAARTSDPPTALSAA